MENDDIYWNSSRLMTLNAMYNMAVGGRGVGKTYDAKKKCIKRWIKKKEQFIYLRRYESETEDRHKLFDDVAREFPGWEFRVYGMRMQIRKASNKEKKSGKGWRDMGLIVVLSKALTKKSVPLPLVTWIIYDEFIIDKGNIRYIHNEVEKFLDFYNTVDRFEDRVRVLFLANAVTITNPYFLYWGLRPKKNSIIRASDGYIALEMIDSRNFRKKVDESRFGKMIRSTKYYDYAVSNVFIDDTNDFLAKKSPDAKYWCSLRFDGEEFNIWVDYADFVYYLCKKKPSDALIYVLTRDDHTPDTVMIAKSSGIMKSIVKSFATGALFFETKRIRAAFMDMAAFLGYR